MTPGNETMGEQPIFTCKAHVFHIDPKTKRSWMSASTTAVSVSFFYDSSRSLYRIISVEGSKAVINSTITPNMTFTKTSQKFGQWSDLRANTVYGLGFSSEAELGKFIEKFQEVKEAIQQQQVGQGKTGGTHNNGSCGVTPVTSANASPLSHRAATEPDHLLEPPNGAMSLPPSQMTKSVENDEQMTHQRAHSVSSTLQSANESPQHMASGITNTGGSKRGTSASSSGRAALPSVGGSSQSQQGAPPLVGELEGGGDVQQQLKYENDRLKLALAQSSANAKKWEVELSTLKSNNLRLTSALQESTANVEEWKRQLHSYKEENARVKAHYHHNLENTKGGGDIADELRKEISILRLRVNDLEAELSTKSEDLMKENADLSQQLKKAQSQLNLSISAHDDQKQVLLTINAQLAQQLHDLTTIHREINTALQT